MTGDPAGVAERRRAAAIAGHHNDVNAANTLFDDADPTVRSIALGALARTDSLTDDLLNRAAADVDPIVRRRLAELVGVPTARGGPRARFDLAPLLMDADASVVEVAAWAAGERVAVSDTIIDRLVELAVDHEAPLVREAAVAALGAIGDERGLDAVLHGCADKPAIRRRAVLALAVFDGPAVDDALEQARHDRDWQVRQSAQVIDRARSGIGT